MPFCVAWLRNYKELAVWWRAHLFFMHIRKNVIPRFPSDERYVLTSQLARAASSVPLNIAEGAGRGSDTDFAHFMDIALGSLNESEYCCFAARELDYISTEEFATTEATASELRAMLIGFLKFLRASK